MADYDKVFVLTPKLRLEMVRELRKRRTKRVLKTLEQLEPCFPTKGTY